MRKVVQVLGRGDVVIIGRTKCPYCGRTVWEGIKRNGKRILVDPEDTGMNVYLSHAENCPEWTVGFLLDQRKKIMRTVRMSGRRLRERWQR